MDDLYREIIIEHYKNPHHAGAVAEPDISYTDVNPLCGDEMTITGRIKNGVLTQVLFDGKGCAVSQAGVSLLLDEVEGKTVTDLQKLGPDDAIALLGINVTPARWKCATLGMKTLQLALAKESSE